MTADILIDRATLDALVAERDKYHRQAQDWQQAAQTVSDMFDPLQPLVTPASLIAVARGVKHANAALRADLLTVAVAAGIVYEADGVASSPGPVDRIAHEIRETSSAATRLREAQEPLVAALRTISNHSLPCDSPCGPTAVYCHKCGDTVERFCAGCVARAALAAVGVEE